MPKSPKLPACFAVTRRVLLGLFLLTSAGTISGYAAEIQKKVLVIGIDGCRFDAITEARTPNLDSLLNNGIYADNAQILGDRYQGNNTISGPGWSSILTGVWADKHGVQDNEFTKPNYGEYPHFFRRLKEVRPKAYTISVADWKPITDKIVSHADVSLDVHDGDPAKKDFPYPDDDRLLAAEAVKLLETTDPTAIFVYLGQVDETGHRYGFHPRVKRYLEAIEQADRHVGELLAALKKRKTIATEDWLIIVTSDHGGQGTSHSDGHQIPEIRNSFLIVSGAAAQRGKFEQTTYLVDVVPTALTHLGIAIDPAWKLDGHAVGLK